MNKKMLLTVLILLLTACVSQDDVKFQYLMRNWVAKDFITVKQFLAVEAYGSALAELDKLKEKSEKLRSYELSRLYHFYGYIYVQTEDYLRAIENHELAVGELYIDKRFQTQLFRELSQLYFKSGNHSSVNKNYMKMDEVQGAFGANEYMIWARSLYFLGDYQGSLQKFYLAEQHANTRDIPTIETIRRLREWHENKIYNRT